MNEDPPEHGPMGSQTLPSFNEQRRFGGDAVMVPDRGFTKQLKLLNPNFEVVWNWGWERWEIWEVPDDRPAYHVMTVQTRNKKYKALSGEVLTALAKSIRFTAKEIMDYLDEMEEQDRRRKAREFSEKIQTIAKDTYNWVHGVPLIQVPQNIKVRKAVQDG